MNTHYATAAVVSLSLLLSGSVVSARGVAGFAAELARVESAAHQGKHPLALDRVRELSKRYPQDYQVALKHGWLAFQGGEHSEAQRAYRRAIALSAGAFDARVGLAWALAKGGERQAAARLFARLRKGQPHSEVVQAGVVATRHKPSVYISPLLAFGYQSYEANIVKSWASSALAGLRVAGERWWLQGAYRYSYFVTSDESIDDFDFHEAIAGLGYKGKRLGFSLGYAYLRDGSGFYDYAHIGAAELTYRLLGRIRLRGSVSAYSDLTVGSAAASWAIGLGPLTITPGLELQRAGGDYYLAATAEMTLRWRWLYVGAGGAYGDRVRPVDLDRLSIYSTPETVAYGGWLGVGFDFGRVGLTLTYAADRFIDGAGDQSVGHFVTLGLRIVAGSF
jgi:tetratricopeptide (TPR) repeat protein